MPQVFQTLRCYKCNVFQVHQTRKDKKWACKICNEIQSIKRHYGIGTAKECRIHVQKLNNLQGEKYESVSKTVDSEGSDAEETSSYNTKINITEAKKVIDSRIKQSKWSTYVEKEQIEQLNAPTCIDNIEMCLELPQKRKLNRKHESFKVSKFSGEYKRTTENTNTDMLTCTNQYVDSPNLFGNNNLINEHETIRQEHRDSHKCSNLQKCPVNKSSKWAQFVNANDNINIECYTNLPEDINSHKEEIIDYHVDEQYCVLEVEEDNIIHNKVCDDVDYRNNIEKENATNPKSLFSLCDDCDLDEILGF